MIRERFETDKIIYAVQILELSERINHRTNFILIFVHSLLEVNDGKWEKEGCWEGNFGEDLRTLFLKIKRNEELLIVNSFV